MKDINGEGYVKGIRQEGLEISGLKAGDIVRYKGETKLGIIAGFWDENDHLTDPTIWVLKEGCKGVCYYWKRDVTDYLIFIKRLNNIDITPKGLRRALKKFSKEYYKTPGET